MTIRIPTPCCQSVTGLQPRSVAPGRALASPTIGRNALVRQPKPFWRCTALPEHVDRDAAARIPVAADPQPPRPHLFAQPLADAHGDILVEPGMIAERTEEQLE